MKIYLRDDLRYDYKKISLIYKTIIAILIAIFIVLCIVVSNNDQALKNNLILEVSKSDSEVDSNGEDNIQNLNDSGYEKTLKEKMSDNFSKINNNLKALYSWVDGSKTDHFKASFSNAFKTLDAGDVAFGVIQDHFIVDYSSLKCGEIQSKTVAIDTDLKNEEKDSNTEKYLYLIKYKFKEDRKNNYNCDDKNYHTSNDDTKNNALKVLTVLSS